MTGESRRVAGVLLVVLPTVMFGGVSILSLLISDPAYAANPLRQDLWRAGHAHAGVLLLLSLIMLRYVDEARLLAAANELARLGVPLAFFFSILPADAREPNGMIYAAYVGAIAAGCGVVTLGVGLLRVRGQ